MPPRGIVLLSGGLDSATVLALAQAEGHRLYALSFRYGQRHEVELIRAATQAVARGVVEHKILDLSHLGELVASKTALVAGSELPVSHTGAEAGIPNTYVPARNTVFLSYALAWAEVVDARDIWIGVNARDYAGYPDCRPAFVSAFEDLANLATKVGVEHAEQAGEGPAIRLRAPLVNLRKHEIIARGGELGVDYANTLSCYEPVGAPESAVACGTCHSCRLRLEGFWGAGRPDPASYA